MSRNFFMKAAAVTLTVAMLAGCGGAKQGPATGSKYKVSMVTDTGGINDESFNASAWAGLKKAEKDLNFDVKYVESHRQEEYEPNFQTLADQKYDLLWGIGFLMEDAAKAMATKLPNQKFGLIDAVVEMPNVASVVFKEEDGSFLMGVLAAKTTTTKKVGFLGGMDIDVIHHFEAGFKAGVKATDPTVEVITVYTGSFIDPGKGKDTALAIYGKGADIIFHAAGNTGVGLMDAAKEQKKFAIGVDQDQIKLAPDYVLSSMMKRVDVATHDVSKLAQEGKFPGGKVTVLGLKEDGVGYSSTTQWNKMPAGTKDLVDKWADAIKAGKVNVPNNMEKFKTWEVPKI